MLNETFYFKSEVPSLLILIIGCTLCLVQEPKEHKSTYRQTHYEPLRSQVYSQYYKLVCYHSIAYYVVLGLLQFVAFRLSKKLDKMLVLYYHDSNPSPKPSGG